MLAAVMMELKRKGLPRKNSDTFRLKTRSRVDNSITPPGTIDGTADVGSRMLSSLKYVDDSTNLLSFGCLGDEKSIRRIDDDAIVYADECNSLACYGTMDKIVF